MNHELEIQITNSFCDETPVDNLVHELTQAGTKLPWKPIPPESGCTGFRFYDDERDVTISLTCEAQTEEYFQYRLESCTKDGTVEMNSVEWILSSSTGPLHELYTTLLMAMQSEYKDNASTESDEKTFSEKFLDALLQDIQGQRPGISFERTDDGFVSESFGTSESVITLTLEYEDDESARFFLKVEKPDESIVFSCDECSKHSNTEAKLRKMFRLLNEKVPIIDVDDASQDLHTFVERKAFDAFFERILTNAIPVVTPIERDNTDGMVLIYDIFSAVAEVPVIRHFLDEIAIRKGPLSELEYKRLKVLAQSTFAMIRHTKRNPNGRVFTGRTVPIAYNRPGIPIRQIRCSSNVSRIANSYTSWPRDIFGEKPAMSEASIMNRCAVLILAAILADQIS